MTTASVSYGRRTRPQGVDRLALVLGLALVAWARRSSQKPNSRKYDVDYAKFGDTRISDSFGSTYRRHF